MSHTDERSALRGVRRLFCSTAALAMLALSGAPGSLSAQREEAAPPIPTNQAIFAPFPMPQPTEYRTGSGAPGPGYWQQGVGYRIRTSLDPAEHRVTGSEVITYTNNSPDALDYLWLQLDQNLFAPGSRGALVNSGTRWRGAFEGGGDRLRSVALVRDGRRSEAKYLIDGTRMQIRLDQPLAAHGGQLQIAVEWSFVVPEYGADRMGRLEGADGWVYEVAQWYPRMFVYDEVEGWNPMPYIGQGEFYLEYGDFDVEITVPRDVIVMASGELSNPGEVLTAEQRSRLERARTSE
ncbi:MAG: hypothetical protein RQ745_13830, partial [Longimicrobiales bacterium]|nr:hypothetical protein [Longimicrobiales bacterium]